MQPASNQQRYVVREIRGMCVGAGAFVVVDTREGEQHDYTQTLWRDEAQRIAARWNAQDRALTDDVGCLY